MRLTIAALFSVISAFTACEAQYAAERAASRAFEAKLAVEASGPRKAFDPGPVCGSAQQ